VLGFVACAAVVRREAFLAVGGFSDVVFFMGEEEMVALDLAAAGWQLAYRDDVVAHHHPSSLRVPAQRRALVARNDLLTAWMRRPLGVAAGRTAAMVRAAAADPVQRSALVQAARRMPRALVARRVVPPAVEAQVRLLEAG
jgi:GT2 family glycosyltransferase